MSGASYQDRSEGEDLGPDEIDVEFRSGSDPTMASPGAAPPPSRVWRWVGLGIAGVLLAVGLARALTREPRPEATPAGDASAREAPREPAAGSAAATPARLPVEGDRMK